MRPQHRKFAAEYIKNGHNGVQAVFAAGYKQGYESACVQASRLLRSAKVKSMIDAITQDAVNDAKLTEERVQKEIAKIAFAKVEVIDSTAKMKGLDLATKVLGMQVQKIESSSTVTTIDPISIQRSIDKIASKTNQPKSIIAQEFLEEWSKTDDPDYDAALHHAIQEIVNSLPAEQIAEQISESSLEQ